jgi:hypothetical protein
LKSISFMAFSTNLWFSRSSCMNLFSHTRKMRGDSCLRIIRLRAGRIRAPR